MRYTRMLVVIGLVLDGCGRASAPAPADPASAAQHLGDSVLAAHTQGAPALAEAARRTMVELLTHPATATFDSLVVMQPAMSDGSWPAPAVCGRIGGKPGVKGASGMTPFIYRNQVTVFVLGHDNAAQFAELWGKYCGGPGTRALLK